ncbi:hypothetical protein JCM10207_000537 [Rhodosporidiobolus poonsookiae]
MCKAHATLFYGITVRTVSLVVAAHAWKALEPAWRAVELTKTRRRRGELETTGGGAVGRVPDEVWAMVKRELSLVVSREVEHDTVKVAHDKNAAEDEGPLGTPQPPPAADETYDLDHFLACETCHYSYFGKGCSWSYVLEKKHKLIDKMLSHFGLGLSGFTTMSWIDAADSDEHAVSPITLDSAECDHWAGETVPIFHGHCDATQRVLPLNPALFRLPANANARFRAFLTSGLPIASANFFSTGESCRDSGWERKRDKSPPPPRQEALDSEGETHSTDEPKWHLWASALDGGMHCEGG